MPDWKSLVEKTLRAEDREEDLEIAFGEPVEEERLAEVEAELGVKLPDALRELYGKFDGAEDAQGEWIVFDTQSLIDQNRQTREDYADWELPHPLENAVMFSDIYGTGDLCAIAVKAMGKIKPGQVVLFDHETGEFNPDFAEAAPDLAGYLKKCAAK